MQHVTVDAMFKLATCNTKEEGFVNHSHVCTHIW